jgi:hypothetical protein
MQTEIAGYCAFVAGGLAAGGNEPRYERMNDEDDEETCDHGRKGRQDGNGEQIVEDDQKRQRDSDRMKSAREAAGKQDESELASLRAEFDALRNQAAEAKKKKLEAGTPEFYAAHKNQPNADELLDLAEKKASVHGTFNASVADRIGIKDPIPKQQLNMLQRLDENTKRLILEFQRANATFT